MTAPRPTHTSPAPPQGAAANGEALAARLGRLRREAGLTLADVAAALGVSKPTVWAWEKGKARPLPERLGAIAAALGVEAEGSPRQSAPSLSISSRRKRGFEDLPFFMPWTIFPGMEPM